MAQKTDLRIIKTERAIRETFIELMYEKGFENIKIQQILDGALINRSTFYAHYQDKYDLRNRIEEDLLEGFAERARSSFSARGAGSTFNEESIRNYLSNMLEYLNENRELVSYLFGPDGDPAFAQKLGSKTHEVWSSEDLLPHLNLPENYVFAGLSGMVSGILTEWARSGFKEEKSEVIDVLYSLLTGISRVIIR